ncbi:Hypothetical protein A7982_13056 [Minicystis rosea]|nr:Hypothetical protein A7982_13056 [Minicystis rosea]
MPIPSPAIDGRSYDQVVSETEALVKAYTQDPAQPGSGWSPPAGRPDAASALVRVFARMAKHVIDRVDRIPDRSLLAFLNLIGVEPEPPRPARVALTFTLAQGSSVEPVVPAGTQVGADPADGDTSEVVFETEHDVVVGQAQIVAAFVRQPDQDLHADRTLEATGETPALYEVFRGAVPVEHALYLAAGEILSLPAGAAVTVTFGFASSAAATAWQALHSTSTATAPALQAWSYYQSHPPSLPFIEWSYWNGEAWTRIPGLAAPAPAGAQASLTFSLPADMEAVEVGGRAERWIRGRLVAWPATAVPAIQSTSIAATVTRSGVDPDAASSSGRPLDLSLDFYPFGERPRFNDTLHLQSAEVLSRPGATVTVTFTPSTAMSATLKGTEAPSVAWEVWTGTAWQTVLTTTPTTTTTNNALRTATFTLPAQLKQATVQGTLGDWLRIRLVGGDFGKGITIVGTTVADDGYRPPIFQSVKLGFTVARATSAAAPAVCLAYNDWAYTDRTGATGFVPFVRAAGTEPVLYLGFDRPFANQPGALYVQVAPLSAADLQQDDVLGDAEVVWEYSSADSAGYRVLGAEDETRGFSESGLLRFTGPADHEAREEMGRRCHWLRARLTRGSFAASPRAGRVLPNTVWATHATTVTDEVLGSSDASDGQVFTLAQTPVLRGQRLEVVEPALPEPSERAELERLEGADAVTVIPGEDGDPDVIRVRWHAVTDFNGSGPRDRHYVFDAATGTVRFGDGVHGMAPPRGSGNVIAAWYRSGGGAIGNRAAGTVSQLKTTIPYVDGVTNIEAAGGGADRESVNRVKERGPRQLRHRGRAVTAEDFEDLALMASPAVARAKAVTPHFSPSEQAGNPGVPPVPDAGYVSILIVPYSTERPPAPSVGLLRDVEAYVRERSSPIVVLRLAGPTWIRLSVRNLKIVPMSADGTTALRAAVTEALDRFLDPLTGGFDGAGWRFGQVPAVSDIYRLLASIRGVDSIRSFDIAFDPPLPTGDSVDRALIYPGTHDLILLSPSGGV